MEKFPDHVDAPYMAGLNGVVQSPASIPYSPGSNADANANGSAATTTQHQGLDRFLSIPRRDNSSLQWSPARADSGGTRHGRQKSLTDAFRTMRTRNGSVSQNAHELADALRAPVSPKLIVSLVHPPASYARHC